jgi:hypothetical protein
VTFSLLAIASSSSTLSHEFNLSLVFQHFVSQEYGREYIKNIKIHNWRSIAARADPNAPYTKTLVKDLYPHGSLYLISWNPHQGSHIHAHHDAGCWFKVIAEQPAAAHLVETRWDLDNRVSTLVAKPGQAAFMHNSLGKHRVMNPTSNWIHSLHLYPATGN